jgi:hypothetical protein
MRKDASLSLLNPRTAHICNTLKNYRFKFCVMYEKCNLSSRKICGYTDVA